MSEQPRSGRLDAETLAAYVDGQLPPEERARVEAEIAVDPESYEWVVNAIRVAEELDASGEGAVGSGSAGAAPAGGQGASANPTPVRNSAPALKPTPTLVPDPAGAMTSEPVSAPAPRPASVIPFYKRRSVQVGIGALLATAAALVLAVQLQSPRRLMFFRDAHQAGVDDVDPHFAKLVAAVGEERYIEGRLTGGFEYGPLRSVTRGPGDLSNQNLALLAAAGELQKAAQENPTADNLHAWGVAQLLLDNQESLDGSIQTLANAVSLSGDAEIRSDLAAAYIQRFRTTGELGDIRQALEESERALATDSGLRPAAFNRAVALELGGTVADAISAWQYYARQEESGEWSAEASRRLNRLRQ